MNQKSPLHKQPGVTDRLAEFLGLGGMHPEGLAAKGHVVVVLISVLVHALGAVVVGLLGTLAVPQPKPPDTVARVRLAPSEVPQEMAMATPAPLATPQPILRDPPPDAKKTRKSRARERDQEQPQPEPPEVRGGLSDSTSLMNQPSADALTVPLGNTSELAVDPSKADLNPPPTAATGSQGDKVDYDAVAVEEAFADASADCSRALPQLDLTPDAINAGVTRGRLVFETVLDASGVVQQVKLIKGTGYDIDKVARDALQGMRCRPAQASGQGVVVRKEIVFEVVDY
jgi:hypothetical protein